MNLQDAQNELIALAKPATDEEILACGNLTDWMWRAVYDIDIKLGLARTDLALEQAAQIIACYYRRELRAAELRPFVRDALAVGTVSSPKPLNPIPEASGTT
jgi:hypothetical protein